MTTWQSSSAHGAYIMLSPFEITLFAVVALAVLSGAFVWAYRRTR
jgi:hypothetical protein